MMRYEKIVNYFKKIYNFKAMHINIPKIFNGKHRRNKYK